MQFLGFLMSAFAGHLTTLQSAGTPLTLPFTLSFTKEEIEAESIV